MTDPYALSPAGKARRAEILRLAQAQARRRRRRRQAARAAAAGVGVLLLTMVLTHRLLPGTPVRQAVVPPAPVTQPLRATAVTLPLEPAPPPKPGNIVVQFIRTNPNITCQLAVPPQTPTWRRLSDDQLIQELADAGHPAGLAWVDGRELILYRTPLGAIELSAPHTNVPAAP
jgi:hypothetical protein